MAKKKNPDNILDDEFMLPPGVDPKEFCMGLMAMAGVTPLEYANFYNMFSENVGKPVTTDQRRITEKNAGDKTFLLKIQMKGVTKPPMWREVKVSSRMNFLQLHEVIQEAVGLDDYHLWQFNESAYNDSLIIGCQSDYGLETVTHDAEETCLDEFFTKPDSKLEYVYDFGDDWIFVVTLKKIIDQPCDRTECTGYKCDLNAMEDIGGIWAYTELRSLLDEWPALTVKTRKQIAKDRGFSSEKDFEEFISDHRIDMEALNTSLEFI